MKKQNNKDRKKGQALVEYIIIVVIVAIAAIAVVGVFSDTVQGLWGGASEELGGNTGDIDAATSTPSADRLQDLNRSN